MAQSKAIRARSKGQWEPDGMASMMKNMGLKGFSGVPTGLRHQRVFATAHSPKLRTCVDEFRRTVDESVMTSPA